MCEGKSDRLPLSPTAFTETTSKDWWVGYNFPPLQFSTVTASSFTVAKTWKPPMCPLMGEGIKMWYRFSQWNTLSHKKIKYYHLRQHG